MNIIEKNNLVEEVYNQLINMFVTGEWQEGMKIPSENELCEIFGVSRNTVRVALNRIVALGIIETRQGYGYEVRNINTGIYLNSLLPTMVLHSKDLESITEFRIAVESEAAALAALRADENEIETMRINYEKAQHYKQDDLFAKYDMEFHLAIAKATKNVMFIKVAEMLNTMYTVWLMGFQRTHGKDKSHDYHYKIYISIKNRDPEMAKRYMYEHLNDVLEKVKIDSEKKSALKNSVSDSKQR